MNTYTLMTLEAEGWKQSDTPNWVEPFPEFWGMRTLMENPSVDYVEYEMGGRHYRVIDSNKRDLYPGLANGLHQPDAGSGSSPPISSQEEVDTEIEVKAEVVGVEE